MAEDIGKLSPDQIKKLAGVISDAKSLTSQQADIIERVLAGEADIGKLRISNLNEYFDIYSRNLDLIARKHSALSDAYLVLDRALTESYMKATANDGQGGSKSKKTSAKHKQTKSSSKKTTEDSEAGGGTPPTGGGNSGGNGTPPKNPKDRNNFNVVSENKLAEMDTLDESDLQQRAEKLARFFQKSEEARRNVIISEQAYLDAIEERRQEQKIAQLKKHAKQVEDVEKSIMDIELLRHQTESDKQTQIAGIRLSRIQKSLEAEYEAQELINNLTAEIAYASGEPFTSNSGQESMQQAQEAASSSNLGIATVFSNTNADSASVEQSDSEDAGQQASISTPNKIMPVQDLAVLNIQNSGSSDVTEAGETRAREAEAKDKIKAAQEFAKSMANFRAKKELEARLKNNGILSKEAASEIEKEVAERFKLEKLYDKKRIEERVKLEAEKLKQAEQEAVKKDLGTLTKGTFNERKQALQNLTHDETGAKDPGKAISAAMTLLSDMAAKLEKKIDDIASYKSTIDTRLQGSSNETYAGSYWDQLSRDMTSIGSINPFFKQETFANNMKELVNRGIAFDLKQRAFLMTIQDKIANTFDVADGTLRRLIRIQQEDSTAGRLGMESALNTFLNNMYETSEYLSDVADSVRGSLEEMQSLMQGAEASEVEYQVQKWLGSLYSVGMSQGSVQSISDALGKIAAGQIEGLTNGGAGNLLIMAANEAGLSVADILTGGINSDDTNKLLEASVNYLAELADSAADNRVVQQQLADVFGVKASDLRAATNLVTKGSVKSIVGNSLNYGDMISQLLSMAGSMGSRTSMAELMTNFWENGQYTLASSMASNPISYFIYKMAGGLDSMVGGIDLPFVNVLGSGVDLNTTVSDLMRVGAMSVGILGSIGPLISGLGSSFSGVAMLNKLGISGESGLAITPRGTGSSLVGAGAAGISTSESGYVGNASGSDIKDSTMQEAADSKKQLMIEAKESEEANEITVLNTTVLKIYELLDDVANGDKSLRVRVDTYGLTKIGSGNGVSPLAGAGAGGSYGSSGGSASGGSGSSGGDSLGGGNSYGANSSGVSGSIDTGGWTMSL